MILVEALITTLGLEKLEEGKALIRAQVAKEPIRINKNIVGPLVEKGLVERNENGLYSMTLKGQIARIRVQKIELDLDTFLVNQPYMKAYVSQRLNKRKPVFKVMVTTCLACGEESKELEHIVDNDVDGTYCANCLKKFGYAKSKQTLIARKEKAMHEWLLPTN